MNEIEKKYITFSTLKNKLTAYKTEVLVDACLYALDQENKNYIDGKPSVFWKILPILKWSLEFCNNKDKKNQITPNEFNRLYEITNVVADKHIISIINDDLYRFLVIISHQQSWYQRLCYKFMFERQFFLFTKLPFRYDISNSFYNLTGLSIEMFLKISNIIFLSLHFDKLSKSEERQEKCINNNVILPDVFKYISSSICSKLDTIQYLNLVTINIETSKRLIDRFNLKLRDFELQPFSPILFSLHPLFEFKGNIHFLHQQLFFYSCNNFIYDYLKINDPNFTTEFGLRMERYVQCGLDEAGLKYLNESQIKSKLPKDSKVTDYLVDDCILLECKAIELPPYESTTADNMRLYSHLKDSVVKAYAKQMLTVANNYCKKECYGLIITYKNLNIGDGYSIWGKILEPEAIKYAAQNKLDIGLLPKENLFLIDLETWDQLIMIIKEHKISLLDILQKVRINNLDIKTRKQDFEMHLSEYNISNETTLSYLETLKDQVMPKPF